MEPVSIAAGCMGLISSIFSITKYIQLFASDVRSARKDMDSVNRELSSMSLSLEFLQVDCSTQRVAYPEALQKNLALILSNTDIVTQQIKDLLQKLQTNRLGRRIQWTLNSRDEMNKLQSALEKQRSCINIALSVGSIQILSTLKKDTDRHGGQAISVDIAALRLDTSRIRENVDALPQIVDEIRALQSDVSNIARLAHGSPSQIQEFLQESFKQVRSVTSEFADELVAVGIHRSEASTVTDVVSPSTSNFVAIASQTRGFDAEPVGDRASPESVVCPRCRQRISASLTPGMEDVASPSSSSLILAHQSSMTSMSNSQNLSTSQRTPQNKSAVFTPLERKVANTKLLMLLRRQGGRDGGCSHSDNACPHVQELQEALDQGADINVTAPGSSLTPLMLEVRHQNVRPGIVRFLLQAGATCEDPSKVLSSIIFSAGESQAVEIVRLIVDSGANIKDGRLLSGIMVSGVDKRLIERNIEIITEYLLEHGADPNASFPVYAAISVGSEGAVRRLLAAGADVDGDPSRLSRTSTKRDYPLLYALDQTRGGSGKLSRWADGNLHLHLDIVRVLLEYGADVRQVIAPQNLSAFMYDYMSGLDSREAFAGRKWGIKTWRDNLIKLLKDYGAE